MIYALVLIALFGVVVIAVLPLLLCLGGASLNTQELHGDRDRTIF